jgi:hypothetical protein
MRAPEEKEITASYSMPSQRETRPPPELVGLYFMTSHKIRPLQAADYIAWEFYQHSMHVLHSGTISPPRRETWKKLMQRMDLKGQIARREGIKKAIKIAEDNPRLPDIARHLLTFDPDLAVRRPE